MRHFSGDSELRLLMEDELEQIAGGNGEDTDDIVEAGRWNKIAGPAVDYLVSFLSSQAADAAGRESRVASQFSPSNVEANTYGWNASGEIVKGWSMRDGSTFFDTDKNFIPDSHIMTDPVGNVWENKGDGWQQIRAVQ